MPDLSLPVAVWPAAFIPGGEEVADATMAEALDTVPNYDAHATGYLVPGGPQMRVRKDHVEALAAEGKVPMLHYAFFDFDTPDHAPIEQDLAAECAAVLADVAEAALGAVPITYTTRAGLRLVFVLAEPVDVRQANPVLEALASELGEAWAEVWPDAPVGLDPTSAQWTRAFRLPKVARDDAPLPSTVTTDYTLLTVGELPEPEVYSSSVKLTDFELVPVDKATWYHSIRPTHFAHAWRDAVAEGLPLTFPSGEWHSSLVKLVGSLTSILGPTAESSEALAGTVISILAPSVLAGATDAGHDMDQLQDLALRFAPNSWVAPEAEEQDVEDSDIIGDIVVGHPTASVYWIKEDGAWRGPLSAGGATTRLAQAYPDLTFATKSHTPYPGNKLVYLYGRTVDEVTYSAYREGLEGHKLVAKLYGRRPELAAERCPEVDEWFDIVESGGAPVREWLTWLGDLSTPIPAMMWHGKAGVGKGLMANAIAKFFAGGFVDWRRLSSDQFASAGWLDTPFVWGDEFGGFADERQSEVFRELVGNTEHTVRAMRVAPMKIETALRIFLTTNEDHALSIRGRASQESLNAVRNRVVGVAVPKEAAAYLEARGGRGGLTKDWVADKEGRPGALVRHLAYLQTQRATSFSGRYPVEAWADPLLRRGAILGNEEEALVWLAAATAALHGQGGCIIRTPGEALINPRNLAAGWNQLQLGAGRQMSATEITAVVKRFSLGQERIEAKRYHRIAGDILLSTLEDIGHDGADRLDAALRTGNVVEVKRRRGLGGGA